MSAATRLRPGRFYSPSLRSTDTLSEGMVPEEKLLGSMSRTKTVNVIYHTVSDRACQVGSGRRDRSGFLFHLRLPVPASVGTLSERGDRSSVGVT
jgi:hypothetical protein